MYYDRNSRGKEKNEQNSLKLVLVVANIGSSEQLNCSGDGVGRTKPNERTQRNQSPEPVYINVTYCERSCESEAIYGNALDFSRL